MNSLHPHRHEKSPISPQLLFSPRNRLSGSQVKNELDRHENGGHVLLADCIFQLLFIVDMFVRSSASSYAA
jgi:hypothetical protein